MMTLPEGFSPDERAEKAMSLFKQGYNCTQSVILAFSDVLEASGLADERLLKTVGSGFGGGMGRLREVCGAFSGCTMMAGFISPADVPADMAARKANYAIVQEFAEKFRNANGGSIVCRELLGVDKTSKAESPAPSQRTDEYYRKRPCVQIIGEAARIIAGKLAESQTI